MSSFPISDILPKSPSRSEGRRYLRHEVNVKSGVIAVLPINDGLYIIHVYDLSIYIVQDTQLTSDDPLLLELVRQCEVFCPLQIDAQGHQVNDHFARKMHYLSILLNFVKQSTTQFPELFVQSLFRMLGKNIFRSLPYVDTPPILCLFISSLFHVLCVSLFRFRSRSGGGTLL